MSPFVTAKYLNDRSAPASPFARHSPEGYPFRETPQGLMLKPHELQNLNYSCDFFCEILDLCKADHLERYCEVTDQIVNRKFRRYGEYVAPAYDPKSNTCIVVLQWVEIKAELPPALRPK